MLPQRRALAEASALRLEAGRLNFLAHDLKLQAKAFEGYDAAEATRLFAEAADAQRAATEKRNNADALDDMLFHHGAGDT